MPVFNTPPAMLGQAVESIRRQRLTDFEFLIVNDGSTGGATLAALEDAAAREPRIRLVRERHRGVTAALNRGLALARGGLIARQDADDWSEPERLERQAAFFAQHPETTVLGCAAWTHQEDGAPLWRVAMPAEHQEILASFWHRNPFVHGSVMFRAGAARAAGGYREELPCSQDYDFFWRLAESGRAANLSEPLYHYRYTAGSVSANKAAAQARAHAAARGLARARRRGEGEIVARALAEATASAGDERRSWLKQADHLMLAGNYGGAARAYLRMIRRWPWSVLAWGKLARLAVFCAAPPARELCFR